MTETRDRLKKHWRVFYGLDGKLVKEIVFPKRAGLVELNWGTWHKLAEYPSDGLSRAKQHESKDWIRSLWALDHGFTHTHTHTHLHSHTHTHLQTHTLSRPSVIVEKKTSRFQAHTRARTHSHTLSGKTSGKSLTQYTHTHMDVYGAPSTPSGKGAEVGHKKCVGLNIDEERSGGSNVGSHSPKER